MERVPAAGPCAAGVVVRATARTVAFAFAFVLVARASSAQSGFENPTYPSSGVAVTDDASGLFVNPAAAGLRAGSELWLGLDGTPGPGEAQLAHPTTRGALALGGVGLFGTVPDRGRLSWGTSLAAGHPFLRFGASLRSLTTATAGAAFPDGRPPGDDRAADWTLGLLSRPVTWGSLGAVADHVGQPDLSGERLDRIWTLGAGVRPLAWLSGRRDADRLTFSADVGMREGAPSSAARVRVGADLEIAPGVVLRGAAEDHGGVRLGITLRGPHGAAHGARHHPAEGEEAGSLGLSFHESEERRPLPGSAAPRLARMRVDGVLADESLTSVSVFDQGSTNPIGALRRQLERATRDTRTRGVLLDIGGIAGMAQIEELRPRVAALRAAGKPVVAYLESGGGRADLYLASACDRIFASPESFWAGLGLHTERRYYRKALADLGIRIDRTSYGKYKSAYRNFSVDSTSIPDRESTERSLDVVQALSVGAIAKDRRLPEERLLEVFDGRAWRAEELMKLGVIDSVGYRENAVRMLAKLAKLNHASTVNLARIDEVATEWKVSHAIAVVYASGDIETGASGNDLLNGAYMGSSSMVRQIEAAFRNPEVKAVVLRIDSPGGSSVGSDLISHAAARMKRETGKPLIVSMARAAASGGYHIAIAGDRLYADRYTVTGSIGVLSVRYSLEGWLRKHQIRQDDFDRGSFMQAWSTGHDWDARDQAAADSATYADYRAFVDVVARARGLSWDEVDQIAQGRVWYGQDALDRKLVDAIGGLDDAIAEARRRAGIPADAHVEPVEYRRPSSSLLQRVVGTWVRAQWQQSVHLPDQGETRFGMDPDAPAIE